MKSDELDLLAFRYIADELSDDERDAFELRLADDQSAREAVARAVELSQATMAALESPATTATIAPREAGVSPWYTRIAWMTSGAVACLLALIGYQMVVAPWAPGPSRVPGLSAPAPTAEVARLANAWSDAQESLRAARVDVEPVDIVEEHVASDAADPMGETPSWVLAAVGAELSEEGDEAEKPVVPGEANH